MTPQKLTVNVPVDIVQEYKKQKIGQPWPSNEPFPLEGEFDLDTVKCRFVFIREYVDETNVRLEIVYW